MASSSGAPTFPELLKQISAAYRAHDYQTGLGLVQKVLELPQTNVSNLDRLGSVYFVMGRYGEALSMWRKALPLERSAKRRKELENAIVATSRSLGLGDALLPREKKLETPAPAAAAPPQAPQMLDPEDSRRYYKRGVKYYAEGEYLQASTMFLLALKLDPDNRDAAKALQRLRLESGASSDKQ